MVLGLLLASFVALVRPAAFFNRRSRSSWLDELAEVRQEALVLPEGGVDHAMSDDDDPEPEPEPGSDPQSEPELVSKLAPDVELGPVSGSGSEPAPDVAPVSEPELVSGSDSEPEPAAEAEAESELVSDPDREAELAPELEPGGLPREAVGRPTPHRERPAELWHPGFDLGPIPSLAPAIAEESGGRRELLNTPAAHDLFRHRDARGLSDEKLTPSDRGATYPEALEGAGALRGDVVDHTDVVAAPSEAAEPGLGATTAFPTNDALPPPVDLFSLPVRDGRGSISDPARLPGAGIDGDVDRSGGASLTAAVIARRPPQSSAPRRALFGVQPGKASGSTLPRVAGLFPDRLTAAPDGTVDLVPGVIRVAAGDTVNVTVEAGEIGITVDDGWCWFALPGDAARPIRAVIPAGIIAVPPGTTALVIIEPDGSTFVAVLAGSASLEQDQGDVSLSAGAVALAPLGGVAEVDTATPSELAREPIVIHNIRLDEAR